MDGYIQQEVLVEPGSQLLKPFTDLFSCHGVWDAREARFSRCALLFISLIPGIVAILVLIINISRPLSRRRPQWLRNFIQDGRKGDQWHKDSACKQFERWNLLLLLVCAAVLMLDLIMLLWLNPNLMDLSPTIAWATTILLLIVEKPRSAPLGCLTIFISIFITQLVLYLNASSNTQVANIPCILSTFCSLASIVIILNQPLRNSNLPFNGIAASFISPTSNLRSPEELLTPWQFMTVSWMSPLLSIGAKRQLNDEDVWSLPQEFQHKGLHERFRDLEGSVFQRLLKANGLDLFILTVLGLLELAARLSLPALLQQLLRSMKDTAVTTRASVVYASIALVVRLISCQSSVFSTWYGRRCYERGRGEMITMLHEKALSRKIISATECVEEKTAEKRPASTGKILNLMKNDVFEVAERFWKFQSLITTPLELIFSVVLIWQLIGWSALFGVIPVLIAQIVNIGIAKIFLKWERVRRAATDNRLQKSSQFVEAIRHLRWYGWQETWLDEIIAARKEELREKVKTILIAILINFMNMLASCLFPVVAFYFYTVWANLPLRIDIAFPALQLFSYLESSLKDIPDLIIALARARIAVQRIEEFMSEPDKEQGLSELDKKQDRLKFGVCEDDTQLRVHKAFFAWPGQHVNVLHDVTLKFPIGLTVILGEVGSGKTALLEALLGEMDIRDGWVTRSSSIFGYCAQSPWLQSMSIKDNILFFSPYEAERYREVLEICQLNLDLDSFKDGDCFCVGENGIGLSGGQKARVTLARAVYSQANILLLDDPLAALDYQTAEAIVKKCFLGPLMKGRTIILVTHRVNLVQDYAQQIIEISAGRARVLDHDASFKNPSRILSNKSSGDQKAEETNEVKRTIDKFLEDEKRVHGGVKTRVYWEYIKAGKLRYWVMLIVTTSIANSFALGQGYFLKEWGEAYNRQPFINGIISGFFERFPSPQTDVFPWLWIFFAFAITRSITTLFVYSNSLVIVYKTGQKTFKDVMQRVSHATFRFYDVTPIGRLMNRLTSDIAIIDDNINTQLRTTVFHAITWIGSIMIIASVTPLFLAFSILLSAIFVFIFSRFLPASQSLRRLQMVSLSPLMSNFVSLLYGLSTVRAFRVQSRFQGRVIENTDSFQKMDHFFWSLQAWLMYRFDALSACSTFLLTLLALYTGVSSGLTAYVLSATSLYVSATHAICQRYGQLQMDFVSFERIVELLHIEQEHIGSINPPAAWPTFGGDIIFDNVTIRYASHLKPALCNISFCIPGGSTTALLGRTGSGKSTLALSILATTLPSEGVISINGIDIAECNTQTLRHRITFLAQDPVLFTGSMRQNLDPLNEHSDEDCFSVLQRICGKHHWTLNTKIDIGGRNLSQGQRQLVGLARAVLRRSSVIILDEATASIDTETAETIQGILRNELSESTVITIAHRLEAVRGADFFVRLEGGKVIEQGRVTSGTMRENSLGEGSSAE